MIINKKDNYSLFYPRHHWDMNYYLVDTEREISYLIDIDDVVNNAQELEEFDACLLWEEFKALDDIEFIKECAWKVMPHNVTRIYDPFTAGPKWNKFTGSL